MKDKTKYKQYILDRVFDLPETSDVTITAFQKQYKLHKVFLLRSPFFDKLIRWENPESHNKHNIEAHSQKRPDTSDEYSVVSNEDHLVVNSPYEVSQMGDNEYNLTFDDPYITASSFELILKRIYNIEDEAEEKATIYNCIITSNYLGLDDVTEEIAEKLTEISNIEGALEYLKLLDSRDIGKTSEMLHDMAKYWLLKEGWEIGVKSWDGLSLSIIAEVVKSDMFFVPDEYDRAIFIIKLIERRLDAGETEFAQALRETLNKDTLFTSMNFRRIMELRSYEDKNHQPYLNNDTALGAVWDIQAFYNSIRITRDGNKIRYVNFINEPKYNFVNTDFYYSASSLKELEKEILTNKELLSATKSTQICPIRLSFAIPGVGSLRGSRGLKLDPFLYAGITWTITLDSTNPGNIVITLQSRKTSYYGKSACPFIYKNNINYEEGPKSFHATGKSSEMVYKSQRNILEGEPGCGFPLFDQGLSQPVAYYKMFIYGDNQTLKLHTKGSVIFSERWKSKILIKESDFNNKFPDPLKICLVLGVV